MFNTIKAKVTAYKWILIISAFSALGIFSTVQYFQADVLRDRTEQLEETNKNLTQQVSTINRDFSAYKDKVDDAVNALEDLRNVFATISDDTASLEERLKRIRELSNAPKQDNVPRDTEQLAKEANELMSDIFRRFEEASSDTGENK